MIATPISEAYKNYGEYNYKVGITLKDASGDPVPITSDTIRIIFLTPINTIDTVDGDKTENKAYCDIVEGDLLISGDWWYWVDLGNGQIYGPFVIKIYEVGQAGA